MSWWPPAYSLFCMKVNCLYVVGCTLNRKYGHEKIKYGIIFHLLLMYHVIPRMRNANFVNKCGDFGTLSYIYFERKKTSYLVCIFNTTCIYHQITYKLCAWRHIVPRPSHCGLPSACAPPSRPNVAVLSHAEYVPTLIAAAALLAKAALSKVAW